MKETKGIIKQPKLVVRCNPLEVVSFKHYAAVINVCDHPCQTFRIQSEGRTPAFWFPIHEVHHWGYAPFYGAAKVVDEYGGGDRPIMLHCAAGLNRSPSVAYAILRSSGMSDKEIDEQYGVDTFLQGTMGATYRYNVHHRHIFEDTIEMLTARHAVPDREQYHLVDLLSHIKSGNTYSPEFLNQMIGWKAYAETIAKGAL